MSRGKCFLVATTIAIVLGTAEASRHFSSGKEQPPRALSRFIWLSDFHLDPFYGTAKASVHSPDAPCAGDDAPRFGAYGCGSPVDLVKAALEKAAEESSRDGAEFVLYSGDYQRHSVERVTDDLWGTFESVVVTVRDLFSETFGNGKVHMVPTILMGNNDFIPDYFVNVSSDLPYSYDVTDSEARKPNPYLLKVAELWRPDLSAEEFGSFAHGGYLSRELQPGLTLLVLNTPVYSSHAWGPDLSALEDPFGQLAWLEAQLDAVRSAGAAAYIHGHIPPVYDSYGPAPMMKPKYTAKLLGIFSKYRVNVMMWADLLDSAPSCAPTHTLLSTSDVISALLFGHLHDNEMRAVPGMPDDSPPLLIHASIAPCYNNAPFVSRVTFDPSTKRPLDIEANAANLTLPAVMAGDSQLEWTRLFDSAVEFFRMEALTNSEVRRLAVRMQSEDLLYSRYRDSWMYGVPQKPCEGRCRATQVCLVSDGYEKESIDLCVEKVLRSSSSSSGTLRRSDDNVVQSSLASSSDSILLAAQHGARVE